MAREMYGYQKKIVDNTWSKKGHALFMEMGTGKTTVVIETAKRLYAQGMIKRVCIIAPKTVLHTWVDDELSAHDIDPEDVTLYTSKKVKKSVKKRKSATATQTNDEEQLKWLQLKWFLINYESLITKSGWLATDAFIEDHRYESLLILDESHRVKNPKAKCTKHILELSGPIRYRRILTGTPISQSPFDLYTQYKILGSNFWRGLNHGRIKSYFDFQHYFGCWRKRQISTKSFWECIGYTRLDELSDYIRETTTHIQLSEVWTEVPEKIYETRIVEMGDTQARDYVQRKKGIDNNGLATTSGNVLTLQQLASGHYKIDPDSDSTVSYYDNVKKINPKIQALLDIDEQYDAKKQGIIFTRFKCEFDDVIKALGKERCCELRGGMSDNAREASITRFTSGKYRWMVANVSVGSLGLNLQNAELTIFYGHTWSYAERTQAEHRIYRLGQQTSSVLYIDIVTKNSVEMTIKQSLQKKESFSVDIYKKNCKMNNY